MDFGRATTAPECVPARAVLTPPSAARASAMPEEITKGVAEIVRIVTDEVLRSIIIS